MTIYNNIPQAGGIMAAQRVTGALCRALYTNHPEAKNELAFRKGDILTVIEYDFDGQPGWWLCALRGQRGICPSNYLEVLEDKYCNLPSRTINPSTNGSSYSHVQKDESSKHQQLLPDQKGTLSPSSPDFVNPLETYDFPRSVDPIPVSGVLSGSSSLRTLCATSPTSSQVSLRHTQQPSPSPPQHIYANGAVLLEDDDIPLYENEGVNCSSSNNSSNTNLQEPNFSQNNINNPLDLYDVPRSELPILGQSLSRLRKYGSCCTNDELAQASSRVQDPAQYLTRGRSVSSLTLGSGNSQVQLRRPPKSQSNGGSITHLANNRSSVQSESAESGIVMAKVPPVPNPRRGQPETNSQDLYDVPRGTTSQPVRGACSRPPSALSMTSSGMGLSIATSDSKDSLDGLYDVPRNTAISVKTYVNHMEAKYDDVRRQRHDSQGSTGSGSGGQYRHTRHNSTSSIFSAYGYCHKGKMLEPQNSDDTYDVPRGSHQQIMMPPPPRPPSRANTITGNNSRASSNGSLNGDDPMQFYDVPNQFARKVGVVSTVSLQSDRSSSSNGVQLRQNGSHSNGSTNTNGKDNQVDVKLLPLGPKAAVSVCEKLRQEVVSSIGSILGNVKPKWRTKENLTEIMPDLKFSCTRLCLAIKDIADFATRSLSNAKRLPEDTLANRLHRLLTPVINGSQIIQRDVDELDAYFWSVDRLSLSGGDLQHSSSHLASGGDALDQLILCSRSLKHDVTELANFLALHSTVLYNLARSTNNSESQSVNSKTSGNSRPPSSAAVVVSETKVEDTQEDYDYVSLVPTATTGPESDTGSNSNSTNSQKLSSAMSSSSSTSTVSWHLDPIDQQLLEFYSAQISVTAPQLSQAIATFISAIQQNEPPSVFNIHLKYVILLAYKLLFAGDTVHRNIGNQMLKEEVEARANDLHKSILTLYEASKIATVEFPKIAPMQMIVDRVWATTQAATQLKKSIFNAVYTSV